MSGIIQKYDEATGHLSKTQIYKIGKLLENNCIIKLNPHCYKSLPIKGYNKSNYTINIIGTNHFTCTCQWFTMKKLECSHIAAVKRYINAQLDEQQIGLFA